MDATDKDEQHYNTTAQQHQFTQEQMVWLNKTNYLGRNRKLLPNWTGLHIILRTFNNGVVELMVKNRRVSVNMGLIKPVTPALPQPAPQPEQVSQKRQQPASPPSQPRPILPAVPQPQLPHQYTVRDDPLPTTLLWAQLQSNPLAAQPAPPQLTQPLQLQQPPLFLPQPATGQPAPPMCPRG